MYAYAETIGKLSRPPQCLRRRGLGRFLIVDSLEGVHDISRLRPHVGGGSSVRIRSSHLRSVILGYMRVKVRTPQPRNMLALISIPRRKQHATRTPGHFSRSARETRLGGTSVCVIISLVLSNSPSATHTRLHADREKKKIFPGKLTYTITLAVEVGELESCDWASVRQRDVYAVQRLDRRPSVSPPALQ